YVFSLENWVLTGVQGGYSVPNTLNPNAPSKVAATCPPYWILFSSPQQSRLASRWNSDFWEPNPRRRSRSLNATHFQATNDGVTFNISNSDDDDDSSDNEEASVTKLRSKNSGLRRQKLDAKDLHSRSSSHLNLPSCCGVSTQQHSSTLHCKSPGLNSSVPLAPTRPLGSHASVHDSSVELLSALSPEEQQLLEAVTEHGYPLRTAIIALQKTGHRCPEQILSYLVACDHLCELGYDESQVEEALEMFQNCETKAKEFLHLLTQFHEMGFQQNTIKEVLLMHGNHRDRALEELMMHVT
ncbi:hypothetical protein QTP86_033543, partial [Hemibagrus guttatus]